MTDLPPWLHNLIDEWAAHQAKRPDAPDDYLANIDYLRIQADEWERANAAMQLVIGSQLAQRYLDERLNDRADLLEGDE